MIANLENIRAAVTGKSPAFGALFSSSLGVAVAEAMPTRGGLSTVAIVALCGAAGAFFGSLPRVIAALSGADVNARKALGNELRLLIERIHLLDQRVTLEQAGKHRIQSEHNNLVVHVKNLEVLLREAGGEVPAFRIKSYDDILGPIDKEIKELMLSGREEKE